MTQPEPKSPLQPEESGEGGYEVYQPPLPGRGYRGAGTNEPSQESYPGPDAGQDPQWRPGSYANQNPNRGTMPGPVVEGRLIDQNRPERRDWLGSLWFWGPRLIWPAFFIVLIASGFRLWWLWFIIFFAFKPLRRAAKRRRRHRHRNRY